MAKLPPPGPPVEEEEPEPTVADMVEVLGEVYKILRIISGRLDSIEAKIVGGGAAVVAPTTGRTRPVTLVGRKDR